MANELGAGNGKGARFATIVSVTQSLIIGLFFWVIIMLFHNQIAWIFSSSEAVLAAVNKLTVLLALTVFLNSVQPVLSGMLQFIYSYSSINFRYIQNQRYCDDLSLVSRCRGWIGLAIIRCIYKLRMLLLHWNSTWNFNGLDF